MMRVPRGPSRARVRSVLLLGLLTSGLPDGASAQDAHHWTYGYGLVGQLTGVPIVGGVNDLSATYYNPGALALVEQPRLTFSLASVEVASIEARGAAGPRLDFDNLVFDVAPSFIAGSIAETEGRRDRFAFAFLSRHDTDWDLGYSDASIFPEASGASAGFGRVRSRLIEYWLGVTWSHRLGHDLAIGITPFLAYRAQRSRRFLVGEKTSETGQRTGFVAREFEYNHGRMLAKLGLAWRPGRWELGATLTTPGLRLLYDRGKVVYNESITDAGAGSRLAASTQTGLDATFRSPWSVAGGASWRGPDGAVHATAEWFSAVKPYPILEPEPAPVAGGTETIPLEYGGAARSVVDFGLGLEQKISERYTIYGGIARSASPWTPEAETFAAWDLLRLTSGVSYEHSRLHLALGLGYAWGSSDIPRPISLADGDQAIPPVRVRFGQWTISAAASFDRDR